VQPSALSFVFVGGSCLSLAVCFGFGYYTVWMFFHWMISMSVSLMEKHPLSINNNILQVITGRII
jgi:hypothetical protein